MKKTKWKTYEEVAEYLLNQFKEHFDLERVEAKQTVKGRKSGTDWEIDAKGVKSADNEMFIIVECRRHTTSRLNQEGLGGIAYRIQDTGAIGGIIVSPLGLQAGAKKIANAENIISVELNADATPAEFTLKFLDKLHCGVGIKLDAITTLAFDADVKKGKP